MKSEKRNANYEKFPVIEIAEERYGGSVWEGYSEIIEEWMESNPKVVTVDCYPGVYEDEIINAFISKYPNATIIKSEDIFYDGKTLTDMMKPHLTEDRVRGVMYYGSLSDFVDEEQLKEIKKELVNHRNKNGLTLICGVGASLIDEGDILVYADLARWEIQQRYRTGMPNFKQTNYDEDNLKKYKRGFFIEWRVADKHKSNLYSKTSYWLDTNKKNCPKMMTGILFNESLDQAVNQPFRTVPYFDPGVWGGQWMKTVCRLDPNEEQYAWSFDGVPEENSVLFKFGSIIFEMPAMNITLARPQEFLGENVYARFGSEFPIRFDFLDTVGGQNLSLQVHPTAEFIKKEYGMPYTQEESYYILDATKEAKVYLGVKNEIDVNSFERDLESASKGEISFPAEQYVNVYPAKRHDHFLIPPGTIHCSATDCMVLEISSSAYIFTFKLWDWDRLGLDGLPRPIHIEEGKKVINYNYNDTYANEKLINHFELIESREGYIHEKTGLHDLEYIRSERYSFYEEMVVDTKGTVHMLNLVDGDEAVIESLDDKFEPFEVHYAETFILPAHLGKCRIKPTKLSKGSEIKVIDAFVKTMI